jgi:hypothetical protein
MVLRIFKWVSYDHPQNSEIANRLRKPKSNIIPVCLLNEILDTIVVARGVEALSEERGGRGFKLIFKLCKRFTTTKQGVS